MEPLIKAVHPAGLLSFSPDCEPIPLKPLNVLIGPNASGKSNLIEVFELLKAAPTDLAGGIRDGGGVAEWLWKGHPVTTHATLQATLRLSDFSGFLRYKLEFNAAGQRLEVVDEAIENEEAHHGEHDVYFYYRFQRGRPVINVRQGRAGQATERRLNRDTLDPQQSVLSQRKEPDLYPEVTAVGQAFGRIQTFREWTFGRSTPLRKAQPADLPNDKLEPDPRNLGLVLNAIEHTAMLQPLTDAIRRFLPRFKYFSIRVDSGTVQIFFHEDGLRSPVPATRLSDGTIRFLALLAILLNPGAAPLICIEEPELGLHPDALRIVADLLVDASTRTQILVTTHSDVLVSALTEQAESVLVCDNLGGASRFRRLESEKLQFWLKKYTLGEVWRMGELGGNP